MEKRLIISTEIEIPDSANTDHRVDERLFSHDNAVAHIDVIYELSPMRNVTADPPIHFPRLRDTPQIVVADCTAFHQDEHGGDHERRFHMTAIQQRYAEITAMEYARGIAAAAKVQA